MKVKIWEFGESTHFSKCSVGLQLRDCLPTCYLSTNHIKFPSFTTCNNNKIHSNKVIQLTLLSCSKVWFLQRGWMQDTNKVSGCPHHLAASSVLQLQTNTQPADRGAQRKNPNQTERLVPMEKFWARNRVSMEIQLVYTDFRKYWLIYSNVEYKLHAHYYTKKYLMMKELQCIFWSYPLLWLAVDLRLEDVLEFECCLIDLQTQVRKSNLDSIDGFYFCLIT